MAKGTVSKKEHFGKLSPVHRDARYRFKALIKKKSEQYDQYIEKGIIDKKRQQDKNSKIPLTHQLYRSVRGQTYRQRSFLPFERGGVAGKRHILHTGDQAIPAA
jgi:hypothetical protein